MRWTLSASVILAIAAGGVSASLQQAQRQNIVLWVPALMAAVPLAVPTNVSACLVAALWLLLFAVVSGFSAGMFYVPAALVMFIAALRADVTAPTRSPGGRELTGAARLSVWISFGLTAATSAVWVLYMLYRGVFKWPACAFMLAPVLAAGLPLRWRAPGSEGTAASLLAACAFFPITIEIGAWYGPAVLPMIYAATAADRRCSP